MNSIMDSMFSYDSVDEMTEEVIIPKRCSACKCHKICSILPTFIAIGKLGIYAGVEICPYYSVNEIKEDENSTGI